MVNRKRNWLTKLLAKSLEKSLNDVEDEGKVRSGLLQIFPGVTLHDVIAIQSNEIQHRFLQMHGVVQIGQHQ